MLFVIALTTIALNAQDFHAVSSEIAQRILASGRKTVAVTDFTDLEGRPTQLGRYLAEEFSTSLLSNAKGFEVIDRTHLGSILQEHKLATTGLIDPTTIRRLGQIAGVETIVTGTMTPFEEYVHLTLKVLDTETAQLVAATTYDVPKTKTISDLIGPEEPVASSVASSTNEQKGTQPDTPTKMPPAVSSDEISFTPKGCRNTGSSTTCFFSITNKSEAAHHVAFEWMTFLVDDQGNQFQMPRITFGSGDLIPDVAMNLSIETQGNVPSSSREMNASLSYQIDWGRKEGKVMIRSIPISQR